MTNFDKIILRNFDYLFFFDKIFWGQRYFNENYYSVYNFGNNDNGTLGVCD